MPASVKICSFSLFKVKFATFRLRDKTTRSHSTQLQDQFAIPYQMSMLRLILSALLFFALSKGAAQADYSEHYKSIHTAEEVFIEGDYLRAFTTYFNAFELNFPFKQDIKRFYHCSEQLPKLGEEAQQQLAQVELLDEVFFTENAFDNVNHMLARPHIDDSLKSVLISTFSYITQEDFLYPNEQTIQLATKINELLHSDQLLRKLNITDPDCKDTILKEGDQRILSETLEMIYQHGFPSRKAIGSQSIHFLLLHGSVYLELSELESLLLAAISEGDYHPSQYARLVDRYQTWVLKAPQIFGEWNSEPYLIEDVKTVDLRRATLGLNSLYIHSKLSGMRLPSGYER